MRSRRVAAAVLTAGLLLAAGCSKPESYIVLSLKTATPTSIDGVADIQVKVLGPCVTGSDGCACNGDGTCSGTLVCMSQVCVSPTGMGTSTRKTRTLTYDAGGVSINGTDERTLSVGFSYGETGSILFEVNALNNVGCSIGRGTVTQEIKKGNEVMVTVFMTPILNCNIVDGGAPEVPPGTILPGCDPVHPQGVGGGADAGADGGVLICSSTQTCQVDCVPPNNAPPRNECIAGGSGPPGTICNTNADCQPGTQCFNYASTGCMVKVCLRFCDTNADCAAFGQTGAGPGSFCEGPVMCPAFLTAYHTCTFNCDPRAMAAATRGGCPTGLACVMPAAMDQVDCACPEATRTGTEGGTCASAADCAPGFICNQMSGTKTCRPICRCNANAAGACTATGNDCPTAGTSCRAVTNNTIYGICL